MNTPSTNSSSPFTWAGAPAPAAIAGSVLKVEDLLRRCLGKRDFAAQMLRKFRGKLPAQLAELREYCQQNQRPQAARLAHELKGAASSLGAELLASSLGAIEDQARLEQGAALGPLSAAVDRHWHDVEKLLEQPEWR